MVRQARVRGLKTLTRVQALLACALLLGVGAAGSLASWSDSELAGSSFTAGSFALVSRTDTGAFAAHPENAAATLSWTLSPLFPGESTAAWVQVQAAGSVDGEVLLSGVSLSTEPAAGSPEAAFRDALLVRASVTSSTDPTPPECTASTPGVEVTGLTQIPVLPAQEVDAAGGSTVTYCIVLTLPADAPAAAQGAALLPTWVITGSTG
ncbi:MAG: hypothetical protein K0R99_825 [Microbacterium sp.]|uniref:SipW-dependent-type signal peptide-containing protein n=1 Tax=Microbacterium sp. TaxID=51671 RepID=UPI002637BF92|nr:SipW-dependent-type signal peptide-containing protein [Microbacterium sp.]MDF2559379.1 hypothetical protein [Microbacterium sp.]